MIARSWRPDWSTEWGFFLFSLKKQKLIHITAARSFLLHSGHTQVPRGSGTKSENAGVRRPVLYDVMQAGAGPADAGLGTWPKQSPGGGCWVSSRAEWDS